MIDLVRKMLASMVEDIDAGTCNMTEEQAIEALEALKKLSNETKEDFSKYSAAEYLHISRATFDNYIAEGKLPHGKKKQGFKELRWYKEDLDNFKKTYKP